MTDPALIWLDAPCAALELWWDAGTPRWRLNRAGLQWALDERLNEADLQVLAAYWLGAADPAATGEVAIGGRRVRYRAVELARRWLLWLLPGSVPESARPDGRHNPADKLALMQGFNRMGFFELDVRSGQSRWDEHMFRLLGLDPSLHPPNFEQAATRVHPEDRAAVMAHRQGNMQHTGRHQMRFRLLLPDGTQRDIHSLSEVRAGADDRPATVLGVLIDDTESTDRVRVQQSISEQLSEALELAQVSVWRIDLRSRRVHYNDTGFLLAGLQANPEGVDLDQMRARVHPDDLPGMLRAGELATASNDAVDVETRIRSADGSYRHLLTRLVAERDAQRNLIGFAGISLDQTTHIADRERAQALARRIQLVADASGVGIWTIENPGEGAAERVEWNAQMFHIYGLPPDQDAPPVRDWMGALVHEDDRASVAEERRSARRSGHNSFETSFRIVRPDGSLRWVVCRSQRDQRDGRTVLHGIHLDVTQQRVLDQTLRAQEQRLQLATQVAGVGIWERDLATEVVLWEEQMYRLRGLPARRPPCAARDRSGDHVAAGAGRTAPAHPAPPRGFRALCLRVRGALARRLDALAGQHRQCGARRRRPCGAHGRAELGRHPAPSRRGRTARCRGGGARQPRQVGVSGAHEP